MSDTTYRPEIDGLRALAVSAVLANHFFAAYSPNGYMGVDVFFVISGFVITASLQSRPRDQGVLNFLITFYTRRIKRLVPALAVCIMITSVLICMVNPNATKYLIMGIWSLFGLGNIYLWREANDYFGDAAELNPFTHTWSLGVEEQFYFLYPLLFWIAVTRLTPRAAVLGLAGLVLASVLGWVVMQARDPLTAFYIVLFRFWQIGLGALAWVVQDRWTPNEKGATVCKWAVLLGVTGVLVLPVAVPLASATPAVVLGTAAFLMLTGPSYCPVALLMWTPVQYTGRISYSLYLWHWPVAVLLKWTLKLTVVTGAVGILVSVILAYLSYRFVEKPLRHARWAGRRGYELLVGVAAMVAIAGLLAVNGQYLRHSLFLGASPGLIAQGIETLADPYRSEGGAVWSGDDCVLSSNDQVGKQIEASSCTIGLPLDRSQRRVLIIGNSYAAALVAAFDLDANVDESDTSFVLVSSWATPMVPEITLRNRWSIANDDYLNRVVPEMISELSPGDRVLIASDLEGLSPSGFDPELDRTFGELDIGLRRLSSKLNARGVDLSMVGPLPFAREARCDPSSAIPQWYAPNGGPCRYYTREETLLRMNRANTFLEGLSKDGVLQVVDVFDVFCPGDICRYLRPDGVVLYRDVWSHPSVEAAQLMRPYIRDWLRSSTSTK